MGGHILGQNAEVINIFAIAIQLGISADKLKEANFLILRIFLISAICYRNEVLLELVIKVLTLNHTIHTPENRETI